MKRFLISTSSLFAVLSAAPAFAGEAQVSVEEIVVTATRSPQPLYRVGSSITVIGKEAIEASQAVVVSDLLTQTPGVSFSRNGGVGGTTAIRIRGAETDQTTVLIDGVKLNDPSSPGGGYNFADLLAGDIERIEILRGAQSTLWGSQAIGGVVNIITAAPARAFEGSADGEGGSRATGYGRLAAGGAGERLTWRLAGGYYTTDGISSFAGGTERDGYQNSMLSGRVGIAVTEEISVDLRGFYLHSHTQLDGFPPPLYAFADTAEFNKTKQFVGYAGVNFDLLEGRFKNRVAYGYTDIDRDSFNPDQPVTTSTFLSVGRNTRWEYQGTLAIAPGWEAVFGAEREKSTLRTSAPSEFDPAPAEDRASAATTSGYAQVQAELIPDLTLTGGLRYDDHETFGSRVLGQAAAAWSLNDGDTVLRTSFAQGFKSPTLFQLYSDFGNLALLPEKADSWDAGIEHHALDGALGVSAIAFYRKTVNQIDFISCPNPNPICNTGTFGFYDNVASARAQGVELAGALSVQDLVFEANYTLTDTKNTSAGNINRGNDLARRPKHTANASLTYQWPFDVSTGAAVRYVGKAFDNAANSFVLQDFTLVDLRTAWQVNGTVEVYGRIENLFDKAHQTARDYGSVGRGAFAGVRARF
jgi:vitamin B12 transporter